MDSKPIQGAFRKTAVSVKSEIYDKHFNSLLYRVGDRRYLLKLISSVLDEVFKVVNFYFKKEREYGRGRERCC